MSKQLHDNALAVQNACNLSGVCISFGEVVEKLAGQIPANVDRRKWLAEHPVFVLFLDKILDLVGWDDRDSVRYSKAYHACEDAVKASEARPETVEAAS